MADSCDLVERTLDEILAAASGATGSAVGAPGKPKPASGGGGGVSGQVMPRARAGTRLGLAGYSNPSIPPVDFSVNASAERLAAYGRYLRGWALLNELSTRKYIPRRELVNRIFAECPHELDFFLDAGECVGLHARRGRASIQTSSIRHQRFDVRAPR